MLGPVREKFSAALDFNGYRVGDRSSFNDDQVAKRGARWASRLMVQMKMQIYDGVETISIMEFFQGLKMASNNNGIYERAALWLFPHFMKNSAAAPPTLRLSINSKSLHRGVEEGILTTYC